MAREQTRELAVRILNSYAELASAAVNLTNDDLDKEVPGYGGRPTAVRNLLYGAANHNREHVNHLNKILDVTGQPPLNEAQAILAQSAQALGLLNGALLRVDDDSLALSHEDMTIKDVLEHIAGALDNFVEYVGQASNS